MLLNPEDGWCKGFFFIQSHGNYLEHHLDNVVFYAASGEDLQL